MEVSILVGLRDASIQGSAMTTTARLSIPLGNRLINTVLRICPTINAYGPLIVAFDLSSSQPH